VIYNKLYARLMNVNVTLIS